MKSLTAWLNARPRDEINNVSVLIASISRVVFGLIVLVVVLRWAWWIAVSAPASVTSSPFGVAFFAACISTAVTVCLMLLDRPPREPRRAAVSSGGGPFRFWLVRFALLAAVSLVSGILVRIPNELEMPWLKSPKPAPACPLRKAGTSLPPKPVGAGNGCP